MNTGLNNGTVYYYVVSALNAVGESAVSAEASSRPVSLVAGEISISWVNNLIQLNWPQDHTGWQLQAQTNGLGASWFTVPGSALTNQMFLPADPANGSVFFRQVSP